MMADYVKQEVPDVLWIGQGKREAAITHDKAKFIEYFKTWMSPHSYEVHNVKFWPGFAWGTVRLESATARNVLLEHAKKKPFRPDGDSGWSVNKFEKTVCLKPEKKKDTTTKENTKPAKKTVAEHMLSRQSMSVDVCFSGKKQRSGSKDRRLSGGNDKKSKSYRQIRSSTASPADFAAESPRKQRALTKQKKTLEQNGHHSSREEGIIDLQDLPDLETVVKHSVAEEDTAIIYSGKPIAIPKREDEQGDLRISATVTKVLTAVKVVEAVTANHGTFKLSTGDILGAANYSPDSLVGAGIVIVLGPGKRRNKNGREFLWAELTEEWRRANGRTKSNGIKVGDDDEDELPEADVPVKQEAIDNAMVNLKRFYEWSIKNKAESQKQIDRLVQEVDLAQTVQDRAAIIRHHLTLASMSFPGLEYDDNDEEDVSREEALSNGHSGDNSDKSTSIRRTKKVVYSEPTPVIRNRHVSEANTEDDLLYPLEDMSTMGNNIFILAESPQDQLLQDSEDSEAKYSVTSSVDIHRDLIHWHAMLDWLTINYFDDQGDNARDHARWVVVVWELAGLAPINLKSEMTGHQESVATFCSRQAQVLEKKRGKMEFWHNLSISTVIHATLCYCLSTQFPAQSVPRSVSRLFATVPYVTEMSGGNVYQMRGLVQQYVGQDRGLIMSPKGYVLFGTADKNAPLPVGTYVLFDAVTIDESVEGKKVSYLLATHVWAGERPCMAFHDSLSQHIRTLQEAKMGKMLHRINSNLAKDAMAMMYESKVTEASKSCGKVAVKDLLVDKEAMDSLTPLAEFMRTRLEQRKAGASNLTMLYVSFWARIGYDFDYLLDDFDGLFAIGSRGCVLQSWEKLLLNFELPNCLDMCHLVRETVAFFSTTFKAPTIDLTDGKSLMELSIKRTRIDRHHDLLRGVVNRGSLWVPQPFRRTQLLEAVLLSQDPRQMQQKNTSKPSRMEIKIRPVGEQTLSFEANEDGSLSADLLDAVCKGTIALKYKMKENVWRIISREGDLFHQPTHGWSNREYIPILRQGNGSPAHTTHTPSEHSLMSLPTTPLHFGAPNLALQQYEQQRLHHIQESLLQLQGLR